MSNNVDHPSHYNQGDIECIDAIESALGKEKFIGFCIGNAIKYSWRSEHKSNAIEDLDKALWYINKAKETMNK